MTPEQMIEVGRKAGLEEAAAMIEDRAQDYNRIRDPGMANHCRACARQIRALSAQGEAAPPAADGWVMVRRERLEAWREYLKQYSIDVSGFDSMLASPAASQGGAE